MFIIPVMGPLQEMVCSKTKQRHLGERIRQERAMGWQARSGPASCPPTFPSANTHWTESATGIFLELGIKQGSPSPGKTDSEHTEWPQSPEKKRASTSSSSSYWREREDSPRRQEKGILGRGNSEWEGTRQLVCLGNANEPRVWAWERGGERRVGSCRVLKARQKTLDLT